ncbi:MAG: gamma carbonic anhydrase family protein [Candidatus Nanopelagicales bacterium]|nr:gamma carbonic anhydrase family protein [Candidatus Nanopelagicales bacterium]
MTIYALGDKIPSIDPTAFIHPDSVIIGDVTVGAESSIWPGAVLRGDHGRIRIGSQTSVQDGAIIHCTSAFDTVIGDRCVIGHSAHLEGCTIMDQSLIGSHSVVLHEALVGPTSIVGAHALVSNGKVVPPGARALGIPAVITLDKVTSADIDPAVDIYVRNSHWYRSDLRKLSD